MIQQARAFYREYAHDFIAHYWLVLLAFTLAAALGFHYVNPAPPDAIDISTGADEGAFTVYAERYRAVLERDGVTLRTHASTGAKQNLERLLDDASGIDTGFVQGGLASDGLTPEAAENLMSLGSMYYEPLWVFVRTESFGRTGAASSAKPAMAAAKQPAAKPGTAAPPPPPPPGAKTLPAPVNRLSQLKGQRVAIGAPGGGTRALALRLLNASGVNAGNTTLLPLSGRAAADALLDGSADAALFLTTLDSPHIGQLLVTPGLALMNLDQADALVRNFPFLHKLRLPHGSFDMERNIPAEDIHLVATTVLLAARQDLHPGLIALLLKAATEVHGGASLLQQEREFPADRDTELPLSPDAARFYKSGPPFLQKYLPFWAATWIDRMIFILLPIIAVLIPVTKIAPMVYSWRIRSKVYHWYGELKFLEGRLREEPAEVKLPGYLERLDWIEDQVNRIRLPLSFSNHVYFLREHIELVRNAIVRASNKPV